MIRQFLCLFFSVAYSFIVPCLGESLWNFICLFRSVLSLVICIRL